LRLETLTQESKGCPGSAGGAIRKLVRSGAFQWCCTGVIVANMVFIGVCADLGMARALATPLEEEPTWFAQCDRVFTCVYVIELLLRLVGLGWEFFAGPDWKWHAFDVVLVLASLVEEAVRGVVGVGIGFLRATRVLRMFRMYRLIRKARFCRHLRLMVCSITQSLGSVAWALLLLLMIMYLFTIAFMQGAIMHLQASSPSGETSGIRDGVVLWYGSVFDSLYTLLASIVGGVDWTEVMRPLEKISTVYRLLFSFYIVFVVVGVLNVLTGIFVERACELSGLDQDLVIQSQMKRNETFNNEMKRIFEEADSDGSGTLTWEEFKFYLENDRVKAYLSAQQLDAFDARTFFDILNGGNGNEMNIEQFIVGCQRLKGQAKSVDLVALLHETRSMSRKLKMFMRKMERPYGPAPPPLPLDTPQASPSLVDYGDPVF